LNYDIYRRASVLYRIKNPILAQFFEAVTVGADLSGVFHQLAMVVLTDPDHGLRKYAHPRISKQCLDKLEELYGKRCQIAEEWYQCEEARRRRTHEQYGSRVHEDVHVNAALSALADAGQNASLAGAAIEHAAWAVTKKNNCGRRDHDCSCFRPQYYEWLSAQLLEILRATR
jgi:hypothetical protein